MIRAALIVFVKAPVLGQVKTRLAREIGAVAATLLYRRLTAEVLRRVTGDRRWRTVLAVTPDSAVAARCWPALPRQRQGRGDLGVRMARAAACHGGPALIIGSDIPGITAALIAQGLMKLRTADVVIGPAIDGGYWLIGWRRGAKARGHMRRVRWSSAHTLVDTLGSFAPATRVTYLKTLRDVDTLDDLRALKRKIVTAP